MSNDLTFFTNEPGASLLDRFKSTLAHVQYFDVLVGYFRTSGFHLLYQALEDVERIRILVGLSVDRQAFEIIDTFQSQARQLEFNLLSSKETKDRFADHVADELAHADDAYETEQGIRKFIEFLQSGKLEIRAHPSQQIHAKVYIQRFPHGFMDYGRVITGSSNFSFSGLQGNFEFNVELKNRADVEFALAKFEQLWAESIELSEVYVDTVRRRTWLNEDITPFELYLKFLYEYFKEEINADEDFDPYLPEGFLDLAYQRQAVVSARRILDAYNGVFLADVVGLGKTFISALLAQQLTDGRILVICPPVLKEYWEETFRDFRVPATVESLGKLDRILERGHDHYKYVFIDEAHRFRNENTQQYEKLHTICWGKKVILVSATPLNNQIHDIFSQLKLFQAPRRSVIPGVRDLQTFFGDLQKRLRQYDSKDDPGYVAEVKAVAREVRTGVLSHVMVRRTRQEIMRYYSQDISEQGLFFPEIADPQRLVYEFDEQTGAVFDQTIELLKTFHYSRYMPRLFLKAGISQFEAQSQRNVGGFMKGLLVKRLESSFYAFRMTLARFIASYNRFIQMFDSGTVLISRSMDIYDLLDRDDEAEIQRLVEEGEVDRFRSGDFSPDFRTALATDRDVLMQIYQLWVDVAADPKQEEFLRQLAENPLLKGEKLLIFSESAETVGYLYDALQQDYSGRVLAFTGGGGRYGNASLGMEPARRMVEANFDPRSRNPKDDVRFLVTTDVLAEGINLHRAHMVVNYDLPWNPTRVLQRVGRVNRVGTVHPRIHIFNFFPTSRSDQELGLEANIVSKLQAFHDMLGEDAKYLSELEEVTQHDLRGQVLYRILVDKRTYEGEAADEESDLAYLQVIRQVRDDDPALFQRIKRLPIKARAGREADAGVGDEHDGGEQMVTFFRRGKLKKFFVADGESSRELDFFGAVDLMRCEPGAPAIPIPRAYFDWLNRNKAQFDAALEEEVAPRATGGGVTNAQRVLKYIRAAQKDNQKMTDEDEDYLRLARQAFEEGRIPRRTSQRIMQTITRTQRSSLSGRHILAILRAELDDAVLHATPAPAERAGEKREIILSAYLRNEP
ncbi:MAG: helicase-related protein [Anaerolineae bacterium]